MKENIPVMSRKEISPDKEAKQGLYDEAVIDSKHKQG